jgi:regulator of nucleoside diphosphate kinase
MQQRTIYMTEFDVKRLRDLIATSANPQSSYLKQLEAELDRATVVPPQQVPGDVITMNSTVRLRDLDSGDEMTYTIVFPDQADVRQGKISILAPIGTALIGYRVGDTLTWEVPAGVAKIKVLDLLYQPESAGDYNL